MFQSVSSIQFPKFQGVMANMMPIIFGEHHSIPDEFKGYIPLIDSCGFEKGDVVYLTVRESFVEKGNMQSRGGAHVESPISLSWGGGGWGAGFSADGKIQDGIYMASNDGSCQIHNEIMKERDRMGACNPTTPAQKMAGNTLYWMTDLTPHEVIPVEQDINRQFFRLVSSKVGVWFSQHNTPNPFGVQPNCPVVDYNKFAVH